MKTDDLWCIGVVGPCTAGKSTLIWQLRDRGIIARPIGQEHSYVKDMWQRLVNPDILIFLDVSYLNSLLRRNINWTFDEYLEQHHRLAHARANTHLYLLTDPFTPSEVADAVAAFLSSYPRSPHIR